MLTILRNSQYIWQQDFQYSTVGGQPRKIEVAMKSKKPNKRCRSRITRAARETMKFHISPAF